MVIKDYKDNKYIELTDDKVIFYKWYGKVILKRDKIKGALVYDDMRMKVLHGNRYRTFNVGNIKISDKVLLSNLIDKLNKENTICSLYQEDSPLFWTIFIIGIIVMDIINKSSIGSSITYITIVLLIWGWPIYYSIKNPLYDIFIYNYKDKIIELKSTFTRKYKRLNVEEDNFDFTVDKGKQYKLSYNKKNNVYIPSNIIYPTNYINIIKELNYIKSKNVFNNEEITFCYYCGAENNNSDVCPSCGKRLEV